MHIQHLPLPRLSFACSSSLPNHLSSPLYKTTQTATPTNTIIPALTPFATAPPLNGEGEAVVDPVVEVVPLVEVLEGLPRVKLAQVRRVALAVWITMERLPKKEAGPEAVER